MRRYALRRILLGILTVIIVSMIIFVASRLSGDVTYLLLSEDATKEEVAWLRAELGLDKPLPIQYYYFAKNALKGDFGKSYRYTNRQAMEIILERLPATVQLAFMAFSMSIIGGLLLGVLSATKRDTFLDTFAKVFAIFGQAMPGFWLGIMMILVFAVVLGWLPTSGRGGMSHIIMPAITLAWFSVASILRLTRSAMLDVLDSEFIKMARLKGNPEWLVIWKHALRNALIPVVAMSGLQLAHLLGGVVIAETIFGWPGLGSLILEGVYSRDYALVQAGVFIISVIFITINLLVDLVYGVIDPRIRYE
ncbi:MAG: ABC transporter permease [Chloroflexi bacterium RBG_13_46_14]|nr:MAG: ABC transporter permease [Chloroflexi bacterium RBG_13_46_14]